MLYRTFSSLKTSVYILAFMCLIFLAGTIFPQGEDIGAYIRAGGKYVSVVRTLDLLDIFTSPLFLFTTFVLLVNLAVCLYDRFRMFLKTRRKAINFERLKNHRSVLVFDKADFEKRLEQAGFSFKSRRHDTIHPDVLIYEKGIPYWWLSWFYHVGIILAILGFFITALFSFESEVLLYPRKPVTISLHSRDTRWNKLLEKAGIGLRGGQGGEEYVLTLDEFRTEYYQTLRIDYPRRKLDRLAIGIGAKKIEPSHRGFSYMPKMWLTALRVKKPDGKVLYAKLWVNKPFRTGPLTLYQMGFEQNISLAANGQRIDVRTMSPFSVSGVDGRFMLGRLKTGTLYRKDGGRETIHPFVTLYYIPEDNPSARTELGRIGLGGRLDAMGVDFGFMDYEEGSHLSYRKDPGVPVVGIACLFVFLGLFVRSFGAWYRIQYAVENRTVYALISTRGILADKDRIAAKLEKKK